MAVKKVNDEVMVVDVSKFFSIDNEEAGKWFQPKVKGRESGIEFKVCGPNSNIQSIADDKFNKEKEEIDLIENQVEKETRYKEALAKRVAAYCTDIRAANGAKLEIKGHEVSKSDIYEIFKNAPVLTLEVMRFASRQENFLD